MIAEPQKTRLTSLILVFLLMTSVLWGCEEVEIDYMQLTNQTSQTTYYLAMTVEQSHLIDLKNPINIGDDTKIILPGETATLYKKDIGGYSPGDDLRFVFYEVISDSAYMSGGLDLTHKQLWKLQFHIVIDDEELTTRYK